MCEYKGAMYRCMFCYAINAEGAEECYMCGCDMLEVIEHANNNKPDPGQVYEHKHEADEVGED
jgi:ribosomal protein L40E